VAFGEKLPIQPILVDAPPVVIVVLVVVVAVLLTLTLAIITVLRVCQRRNRHQCRSQRRDQSDCRDRVAEHERRPSLADAVFQGKPLASPDRGEFGEI